jgi:hypothetical protein
MEDSALTAGEDGPGEPAPWAGWPEWKCGIFATGVLVAFTDLRGTAAGFSRGCWRAVLGSGLLPESEGRFYGVPKGWACFAVHRDVYVQERVAKATANPAFPLLSDADALGRRVVIEVELQARGRRKGAGGGYLNFFGQDALLLERLFTVGPGLGAVPGVRPLEGAADRGWERV